MRHRFQCIDGHTGGNPVRVVHAGAVPTLVGDNMSARRQDFLVNHDWVRKALVFEPRGHDMMSGTILYPPLSEDADAALIFIETSGSLPMCGHGLIGTVTIMLEHGLIIPREEGKLVLDVPAGRMEISYVREGESITGVTFRNVPAFLLHRDVHIDIPALGAIKVDVAYGGNFYAIVDPQPGFGGLDQMQPQDILQLSPLVRSAVNEAVDVAHPVDCTIRGCTHVQWTGMPEAGGDGRNAVFYGDKAIDRSPCGTGTSARMAQLVARGKLQVGDSFTHESIIGSLFKGRVEAEVNVGGLPAIIPSIEGRAFVTGFNTIFVDERDPFPEGFQLV